MSFFARFSPSPWRGFLRPLALWRGADGAGLPLWQWASLWLLLSIWAQGFAVAEPLAQLISPFLGFALLVPVLQQAATVARGTRWQRGWWLLEPVLVMCLLALLAWDVWGYVYHHRIFNDRLDHHIMMGRADEVATRILGGEYPRYSYHSEGGDSLVDLYPSFLNLVFLGFRLLSPRGCSVEATYTALTLAAWWLRGVAVYHLARRFAGPLLSLALAVAALFEVGAGVWDGVWTAALYYGMVHSTIALTFGLYVTAFQIDLLRRFTRGRILGVALASLVTCASHPIGMIYLTMSSLGQLFALWWGRVPRRRALRTGGVLVASLLLCAFMVLPFSYAMKHYGFFFSVDGLSYEVLGGGLLGGRSPESSFGGLLGLGMVAIVAGLLSRRAAVAGPSFVSLVLWTLVLSSFLVQTRFYAYVPSFLDGQPRRLLTVFKTALIPSVAWALSQLFRSLRRPASLRPGRVFGRAALLALLLLPLGRALASGFDDLRDQLRATIPNHPPSDTPVYSDSSEHTEKVLAWLRTTRANDHSPTPWRLALHYADREYSHARFWGESYRLDIPMVDYLFISGVFLGNRPRELTEDGYKDWNIKYVLCIGEGKAFAPDARLMLRFSTGNYRIYEYRGYDPRWVAAPAGVRITELVRKGDELSFEVSGAPPEGAHLLLRIGYLPRWQAHQDGHLLPLGPAPPHPGALPRQDQVYFLAHNGHVTLDARGTMPRTLPGAFLSLLGAAALAFALQRGLRARLEEAFWARFDRLKERIFGLFASLDPTGEPFSIPLSVGLVLLGSLASLWASRRYHREIILPPIEGEGMWVTWADTAGERRCVPQPHFGRYQCLTADGEPKAMVDGWLGYDAALDHTGEYNRQWAGIRIVSPIPDRISLVFPHHRFPSRRLRLKVSAYGRWTLSGLVDGVPFATAVEVSTHEEVVLELPADTPSVGRLRIYAESQTPRATLILSGAVDEP